MSMRNLQRAATLTVLWIAASVTAAQAEGIGIPASNAEVAARRLNVFPDGAGLPDGKGTAIEGKSVYALRCASCHGQAGTGGSADELAGGRLDGPSPDKTIGTYWPYATTVVDFVRRSMPLDAPGSLSSDQVYAVTAYLLSLNGIIEEHAEMNSVTLPKVKMPNRDGFIAIDAPGAAR